MRMLRVNKKPRAAPSPSRGVARGFDPFTDGDESVREVRFRLRETNYSIKFSLCEDISCEENFPERRVPPVVPGKA